MSDIGARFYAATDAAPLIGDVFVHFSPFLKLYSTYYRDFDRADQTLKRCLKKSSKLRDFCQQVLFVDVDVVVAVVVDVVVVVV
jgi:hypothetical protein